jgi:hypothetical protein
MQRNGDPSANEQLTIIFIFYFKKLINKVDDANLARIMNPSVSVFNYVPSLSCASGTSICRESGPTPTPRGHVVICNADDSAGALVQVRVGARVEHPAVAVGRILPIVLPSVIIPTVFICIIVSVIRAKRSGKLSKEGGCLIFK